MTSQKNSYSIPIENLSMPFKDFTDILKNHKSLIKQSISRKGNHRDNALAAPFFKSLKVERWVYEHNYGLGSKAELSNFNG